VYASYLSQLYSFIDGSLDLAKYPTLPPSRPSCAARYEDNTRNILGNRSYPLFTIDKVPSSLPLRSSSADIPSFFLSSDRAAVHQMSSGAVLR
jgi:hypothetical protein